MEPSPNDAYQIPGVKFRQICMRYNYIIQRNTFLKVYSLPLFPKPLGKTSNQPNHWLMTNLSLSSINIPWADYEDPAHKIWGQTGLS